MRNMVVFALIASLMPLASAGAADMLTFEGGVGTSLPGSADISLNRTPGKTLAVSYRHDVFKSERFSLLYRGAYWTDTNFGGTPVGVILSVSPRVDISAGPLYGVLSHGVGVALGAPSRLDGTIQFVSNVAVGLQDKDGYRVGWTYTHVSSGSPNPANHGRDTVGIELGIPLSY